MSSKKIRKGPSSSATTFKLGTRRKGNDGNMWKVSKTQKGVKRWVKITKKKSPVKKSRKITKKKSPVKKKKENLSKLLQSIEDGDIDEIENLLTRQNVNKKNQNGNTPLMYSVYFGNMNWNSVQIVRMILDKGGKVNVKDKDGNTPLLFLCNNFGKTGTMKDNVNIMKMLLNKKANVNTRNKEGLSPLMCAIKSNYPKYFKMLLDNGTKLNLKDKEGNTALDYAKMYSQNKMAKTLVKKGAH